MKNLFHDFVRWWLSLQLTPGNYIVLTVTAIISVVMICIGYQVANEVESTPCSFNKYPANCYRIKQNMCEAVWSKAEGPCKEAIRKLSLPPTRLIGPILFKCQTASLDRAFAYSRISSPECDDMHAALHDWEMRNTDFK